ncbi:hypothetical protein I5907_17205 [Panacibacter sp. DH6]|uniref:DUF4595 domain-containing protein n=1 Tax=Panacibacter microcysteis TaxID=2793269 RepID=A0A931GZ22_9BACT|nr:hypothetical protein [Panacibacter microcysteis]MBG9377980.1 hypothetical protein [Panacibacter microcysteis]
MKNAFYLLVLAAAFFTSCKKDDKPAPGPGPEPTPQTAIQKYVNGDDYIAFTYAGDAITQVTVKTELATAGDEAQFDVLYNTDKTIKELRGSNGQQIVPLYESGRLARADIMEQDVRLGQTVYNYENDQLSIATIYLSDGEDLLPALEFRFTYSAGNIMETVIMVADETPNHMVRAGSVKMEYDAHANPLYAYNDLLMLFWQVASENNVTVENHLNAELQAENKYVYTYTYLDNGLPASAAVKIGLPGTPQTDAAVDFIYK